MLQSKDITQQLWKIPSIRRKHEQIFWQESKQKFQLFSEVINSLWWTETEFRNFIETKFKLPTKENKHWESDKGFLQEQNYWAPLRVEGQGWNDWGFVETKWSVFERHRTVE